MGPLERTVISRRSLMAGMAAAVVASATQVPAAGKRRIDVHHHVLPSFLPNLQNPGWTPEQSLDAMGKYECETAILSFVVPPEYIYDGSHKAEALVRRANEYCARLASDHPKSFGFFAALPLLDINASLKEIAYAFNTLHCDGIVLMTNAGKRWPGDPLFQPVFEELDRRGSAVFFHPAVPTCCKNLVSGIGDATLEYEFDTTRAITSLLVSGTLSSCQNIRWIVNHSGAALPALSSRIKNSVGRGRDPVGMRGGNGVTEKTPKGVLYELQRLYYECATATTAPPMAALRALAPHTQYLFGSDFPVVHYSVTVDPIPDLSLPSDVQYALNRGNAERIWPRLKSFGAR